MYPFFSIITPTLQRESLVQACASVTSQSFRDWEMLIQVDSMDVNATVFNVAHPHIRISSCGQHHANGGNTCRRLALARATGTYCLFLDDDNYLADDRVLEDIFLALENANRPAWALFPILRLGRYFFSDPPRSCHVDTMNFILRRDVADWPETDAYGTDWIVVDGLLTRGIPYVAFPDFRPIGVIPKISFCK